MATKKTAIAKNAPGVPALPSVEEMLNQADDRVKASLAANIDKLLDAYLCLACGSYESLPGGTRRYVVKPDAKILMNALDRVMGKATDRKEITTQDEVTIMLMPYEKMLKDAQDKTINITSESGNTTTGDDEARDGEDGESEDEEEDEPGNATGNFDRLILQKTIELSKGGQR
jgi:hypothetical protein